MPRPPNYGQQRGDRNRAKEQKKMERLQRREEDAAKRKAERERLLGATGEPSPAKQDNGPVGR